VRYRERGESTNRKSNGATCGLTGWRCSASEKFGAVRGEALARVSETRALSVRSCDLDAPGPSEVQAKW
jgi:hypothetical protein